LVCEGRDLAGGLVVGIGQDFCDRKETTGLEARSDLAERRDLVWDFPKNGNKKGSIESCVGKVSLAEWGDEVIDVGETGPRRLFLGLGDHPGLDI
jgi:hypothetical protein